MLSKTVDLLAELGTPDAFVGFTSATGGANAKHDILAWEFTNDFEPIGGCGTKAAILDGSGVQGKGILSAPGLQKEFNPKSKAAERAGKKK